MSDLTFDFNNLKKPDFDDLASEIQTKAELKTPAKITIGKEAKRSGGVLSKPVTFEYENGTVITVNIAAPDGLIANVMVGKNVLPIQKSDLRDVGKLATKVASAILYSEGQKGKVAAALGAGGGSDKKATGSAAGVTDEMKKGKIVNKSNAKALLDDQIHALTVTKNDKIKTVQEKKDALGRLQPQTAEQDSQVKDLDKQIKDEGKRWGDLNQQLKDLKKAGGITESAKSEDDDSDNDDSGKSEDDSDSEGGSDDNTEDDDSVMENSPYTMTPRQDRQSRIITEGVASSVVGKLFELLKPYLLQVVQQTAMAAALAALNEADKIAGGVLTSSDKRKSILQNIQGSISKKFNDILAGMIEQAHSKIETFFGKFSFGDAAKSGGAN